MRREECAGSTAGCRIEPEPPKKKAKLMPQANLPVEPVEASPESIELDAPELYLNRELSWLEFNHRVLQLAEDSDLPLLERVKFCAIYESNLDEFYMVRVANLHDQQELGMESRGADDLSAGDQLAAIRGTVIEHRRRLDHCFEGQLLPQLAEHGLRLIRLGEESAAERTEIDARYLSQVFPALTPLVVGMGRPFPYISNLALSLLILLRDPDSEAEVMARVKVPEELLGRFLRIGEAGLTLVPLEDAIAANLATLFPGMEILESAPFRVTRDTDYDISDEADDLRQAVEDELRRRRFGEVVRLEVQSAISARLRDRLISELEIEQDQVYDIEGMLGLDDLWGIVAVPGFADLRYTGFVGITHPRLQGEEGEPADVMSVIRESGDLLVHHPYDAFSTSVEAFVRQAVADPEVLAIKQTVYRTSADSPLVRALITASERGKQAVCMVELQARFDEQANIEWAKKLEKSGVHVVYGIPSLKTHAKCILVARREGDGVRHYAHIGTGNYNSKTASLYTDLGLFTDDPDLGADIAEMFNYLTGFARPQRYRKALVAPFNLQKGILKEIRKTVKAHQAGRHARIRMKMNSLLDPASIEALYEASQAGVPIDLNVRGICGLRPGLAGISETIKVVSVVGRFLEHSRIYSFERGAERHFYIGSADLMPRNLYTRVELLAPVEDPKLRDELSDILDLSIADDVHAWDLDCDGNWTRRVPKGKKAHNVQRRLIDRTAERAAELGSH